MKVEADLSVPVMLWAQGGQHRAGWLVLLCLCSTVQDKDAFCSHSRSTVPDSTSHRTMSKTALIIVDYQNDFLPPDGALAVAEGRDIAPALKSLLDQSTWEWDLVVATQVSL